MKRRIFSVVVLCLIVSAAFAAAATVEKEPTAADLVAKEIQPWTFCSPTNCHTYGENCDPATTVCQCTSGGNECTCKPGFHNKHRECHREAWFGFCWEWGPYECDACNTPNPVGCQTTTWANAGVTCAKKCTQCMPGYAKTYDHKCAVCTAPSPPVTFCTQWSDWTEAGTCKRDCRGCGNGHVLVNGKCECTNTDHCLDVSSHGPDCSVLCLPGSCEPGWQNTNHPSVCTECSAPASGETEHCSGWRWLGGCTWECTGCKDGRALVDGRCECTGRDPHCQGSVSYGPTCESLCPPGKCVPGWTNDVTGYQNTQCTECTGGDPHCQGSVSYGPTCEPLCSPGKCVPGWTNDFTGKTQCSECSAPASGETEHCSGWRWLGGCTWECTGCKDGRALVGGRCECTGGDPHCQGSVSYGHTCEPLCPPGKCVPGWTNSVTGYQNTQCTGCAAWEPVEHCREYGEWVNGCKKLCTGCEDGAVLEGGHCACKDPHCQPQFDVSTSGPTCNPLCKPKKCNEGYTNFDHKGKCTLKNFCPANTWEWKDTPRSSPRPTHSSWCAANCNVNGPSYIHPACIPTDYAMDPLHRRCYCKDPKFE